MNNLQRCR